MKSSWNANTWVVVILSGLVVVMGVEAGRKMFSQEAGVDSAPKPAPVKPLEVGQEAPDFTLKLADGKERSLKETLKRDTILCFSCGCNSCRSLYTYLGKLQKKLGPKGPDVITVATTDPAGEAAWKRDTGLKMTAMFYDGRGKTPEEKVPAKVMDLYQGHPCPRVYRVESERTITWIGPSPNDVPDVQIHGYQVAAALGFNTPMDPKGTAPRLAGKAPSWGDGPGPSQFETSPVKPATRPAADLSLPPYAAPNPYGGKS